MVAGDCVAERDVQEIVELMHGAERGEESAKQALLLRLHALCGRVTSWQWVIHGDTGDYRKTVCRWLVRQGKYTAARRFALCGRGDVLVAHVDGRVRVKPMGCGVRCCPRCSRRCGRSFLSRVSSHLASREHGSLCHVVLTQQGLADETLDGARRRFDRAWKRFYPRLRRAGLRGALATYHVTPSMRLGWHYHCHLLIDVDPIDVGVLQEGLADAWAKARRISEECNNAPFFCRLVAEPGAALVGLAKDTQLEFFEESPDPVERCLQYMVRDILQGVERWVGKLSGVEAAEEFAAALSNLKTHRLYGTWRKKVTDDVTEKRDAAEDRSVEESQKEHVVGKTGSEWYQRGGMDVIIWAVRRGESMWLTELVKLLGARTRYGDVGLRLWKLVSALQR